MEKFSSSSEFPCYHAPSTNTRLLIRCVNPKPTEYIKTNSPNYILHAIKFPSMNSDKLNNRKETRMKSLIRKPTETHKGPAFSLSSSPSLTRASTPTPSTDEFSSLAMNTAITVFLSLGFLSPSLFISSVTSATCPRQSVVPRPRSLSPSTLREKGSNSCGTRGEEIISSVEKLGFGAAEDGEGSGPNRWGQR